MKRQLILLVFSLISVFFLTDTTAQETLYSPDKNLRVEIKLQAGRPMYRLWRNGEIILDYSSLEIEIKEGYFSNLEQVDFERKSTDYIWEQVWGEDQYVRDNYNELTLTYQSQSGNKCLLQICFRMYNDGMGLRYIFPEQENLKSFAISKEKTMFTIPAHLYDAKVWAQKAIGTLHYEGLYTESTASEKDTINPPITIIANDSLYMCIAEAAVWNYPATMYAEKDVAGKATFTTELYPWRNGDAARVQTPFASPWRYIVVAKNPEGLITSRLILNLNEPCKIEDVSWIKPSKYVGIWWGMHKRDYTWEYGEKHGATTERTKKYIDFASKNNIPAVLVEGWNTGWDGDWGIHGDRFSFTQAYPDYDLFALADYAKKKNVRIIAHAETAGAARNLEKQMDTAFFLYHSLGMNTVKTGYVNFWNDDEYQHSQQAINHYNKVVTTAAEYKLMVVAHEAALPSGIRRTYPNIIGTECMRGQEYNSWDEHGGNPPYHTCVLPFTRGLMGPMDFTPGIFNFENKSNPKTHPQTTLAKQLAEYIVLYSPAPMAADMIENYEDQPAFAFIKDVPTNWQKTIVPHAEIGKYITIARKERDSDNWYVGSMTDETPRNLVLELYFLDEGREYELTIYCDGEGADYRTNPYPLEIKTLMVNNQSRIPLRLAPSGGAAISIKAK